MRRAAIIISILGALVLGACGEESSVSDASDGTPAAIRARAFVQAAGMVKSLGIT